jgi:hypothetical protein
MNRPAVAKDQVDVVVDLLVVVGALSLLLHLILQIDQKGEGSDFEAQRYAYQDQALVY